MVVNGDERTEVNRRLGWRSTEVSQTFARQAPVNTRPIFLLLLSNSLVRFHDDCSPAAAHDRRLLLPCAIEALRLRCLRGRVAGNAIRWDAIVECGWQFADKIFGGANPTQK